MSEDTGANTRPVSGKKAFPLPEFSRLGKPRARHSKACHSASTAEPKSQTSTTTNSTENAATDEVIVATNNNPRISPFLQKVLELNDDPPDEEVERQRLETNARRAAALEEEVACVDQIVAKVLEARLERMRREAMWRKRIGESLVRGLKAALKKAWMDTTVSDEDDELRGGRAVKKKATGETSKNGAGDGRNSEDDDHVRKREPDDKRLEFGERVRLESAEAWRRYRRSMRQLRETMLEEYLQEEGPNGRLLYELEDKRKK